MSRTLEQALSSLSVAGRPITTATLFSAYLEVAGFVYTSDPDSISEDAIIAFEHALDKYPAPPPPRRTKSGKLLPSPNQNTTSPTGRPRWCAEVAEIREEYWRDTFGRSACKCCCRKCGGLIDDGKLVDDRSPSKKRVGKKRKVKKCPTRVPSTESEIMWDAHAPSTSAFVL